MNAAGLHAIDGGGRRTRRGLVRAAGPQFVDDDGPFYPLGATLFWGLGGWLREPERVKANLAYLGKFGFDYVRTLGHVDWPGNGTDWRTALTEDCLGQFLDYAYGVCGLRTDLALLGSYDRSVDLYSLCRVFAEVTRTRTHTILNVEMCNEAYQNGVNGDLELLRYMADMCRSAGVPNLLALSSAEGADAYGLTFSEIRRGDMLVSGADLQTVHMDRNAAEDGCRFMRQPYDWRDLSFPVSHNEPIGPLSSVSATSDALQLATLRACGLMHGVGAFVLHNAAGVAGQVDPRHGRPANVWETPGIDACMQAVRNVDAIIRPDAGAGRHWNNEQGNPFRATSIWPEDGHGANRRYTVEYPDGFLSVSFGMAPPSEYQARQRCLIDVYDPVRGEVVQQSGIDAGTVWRLEPVTLDQFGHGAVIVRGSFV